MNRITDLISRYWQLLTGDPGKDSPYYRVFNAANLLSIIALAIFVPFNYFLGLPTVALLLLATLIILIYVHYLARFRQKLDIAIIIFALLSYSFLIFNFYWNSGIDGPTTFSFFLIFHLLIAISHQKYSWIWLVLHMCIGSGLLFIQYFRPEWIPYSYNTNADRFLDINVTFIVLLICIYFLTGFIRKSYHQEKGKVKTQYVTIQVKNEQLELINAERNRLFSIISHDLRSPLSSIQGYLEMLSGYPLERETRAEIEAQLLDLTKHTSSMLYNLLSWSSAQLDGSRVHIIPLPLLQALRPTLELQKAMALTKQISLYYEIDPDLHILADAAMLELVVRNILSNAIKFTNNGGEVFIQAQNTEGEIILSIRDNGVGIPEDQAKRIFTSVIQPLRGTKDEPGLGLGLLLCRDFIELQQGRLWFHSHAGEGTTFYIALPELQPAQ